MPLIRDLAASLQRYAACVNYVKSENLRIAENLYEGMLLLDLNGSLMMLVMPYTFSICRRENEKDNSCEILLKNDSVSRHSNENRLSVGQFLLFLY